MAIKTPAFNMFKNPVRKKGAQQIYRVQNRLNTGAVPEDRIPKVSNRLTGLQNQFRQPIQNRIDRMGNRMTNIQGRLDAGGLDDATQARLTGRLGKIDARQGRLEGLLTPYQQAQTPAPEAPPAPAATGSTPEEIAARQAKLDSYMKALFPQTDAHNMDKYLSAMEPSRAYEEQRQTDLLSKYMAAKGGRSSGFAAQKLQDQNARIGADYGRLAMDYANTARSRDQQNAERLRGVMTDEAERAARGEQNNFDNRMRILENMLNQGNTLLGYGYDAAKNSANLAQDFGKTKAGMTSSEYMGMPPMGAFPMGHTATPPFIPQFPNQPSTTNADLASLFGGQASNTDYIGALTSGMGMLDSMGAFGGGSSGGDSGGSGWLGSFFDNLWT